MGFDKIWEMRNVHCLMLGGLDSIAVYRDTNVIGGVSERTGEPSLSLYGTQTLTFNDLEIIQDNWYDMVARRASANGTEETTILEIGIDIV